MKQTLIFKGKKKNLKKGLFKGQNVTAEDHAEYFYFFLQISEQGYESASNYVPSVQQTRVPFMAQKHPVTVCSLLNNSQISLTFYCSLHIKIPLSRMFVLVTEICLKETLKYKEIHWVCIKWIIPIHI